MISFNSVAYLLFLSAVVAIYWKLNRDNQNRLLLAASYLFYGSWDWRFLFLIFTSTAFDFYVGKRIHAALTQRERKAYLITSLVFNVGLLCFFKYINFFTGSMTALLRTLGFDVPAIYLDIILPIGISFLTFQTMSYPIDIYRKKIAPEPSLRDFALFLVFFPQLVAGPIERAAHLLPHITRERTFGRRKMRVGIELILWGLIKKVFIADNIAYYVNIIFDLTNPSTLMIAVGTLGFGIQIFSDFSAYSDIARGSGRLLGFDLVKNFHAPYLSRNIIQFWKRWHISLSLWIRDYIYIPLGGNRCSPTRNFRNLFVTWFLCGLWHGASWHFVAWGLYHGMLIGLYRAVQRAHPARELPKNLSIAATFLAVTAGWLLFRIDSIAALGRYFSPETLSASGRDIGPALLVLLLFLFYCLPYLLSAARKRWKLFFPSGPFVPWDLRLLRMVLLILILVVFWEGPHSDFIYFQF